MFQTTKQFPFLDDEMPPFPMANLCFPGSFIPSPSLFPKEARQLPKRQRLTRMKTLLYGCLLLSTYRSFTWLGWTKATTIINHNWADATLTGIQEFEQIAISWWWKRMLIEFLVMFFFAIWWLGGNQGAMAIDILQCGTKDLPKAAKLAKLSEII